MSGHDDIFKKVVHYTALFIIIITSGWLTVANNGGCVIANQPFLVQSDYVTTILSDSCWFHVLTVHNEQIQHWPS